MDSKLQYQCADISCCKVSVNKYTSNWNTVQTSRGFIQTKALANQTLLNSCQINNMRQQKRVCKIFWLKIILSYLDNILPNSRSKFKLIMVLIYFKIYFMPAIQTSADSIRQFLINLNFMLIGKVKSLIWTFQYSAMWRPCST